MTFPERGIIVVVMSNISYADTSAMHPMKRPPRGAGEPSSPLKNTSSPLMSSGNSRSRLAFAKATASPPTSAAAGPFSPFERLAQLACEEHLAQTRACPCLRSRVGDRRFRRLVAERASGTMQVSFSRVRSPSRTRRVAVMDANPSM